MDHKDGVIGSGPYNRIPQFGFLTLDERKRFFKNKIDAIQEALQEIEANEPEVKGGKKQSGKFWSHIDPRTIIYKEERRRYDVDENELFCDVYSKNQTDAFQTLLDAVYSVRCLEKKTEIELKILTHLLLKTMRTLDDHHKILDHKIEECRKLGPPGEKYLETMEKVRKNIFHINEIFLKEWIEEQKIEQIWSRVCFSFSSIGMGEG